MKTMVFFVGLLFAVLPAGASAAPITNVEDARLAIVEAVNTDRENFGGVYLDAAGTLVIQYVGLNAGADAVQARMDRAVPVRWVKVDRSRADLENVMTAIREGNFPGVMISELDTINNQVKVSVSSTSKHGVDAISNIVAAFGPLVSVVATDDPPVATVCNTRFVCTPWRGGIQIVNTWDSGVCTWGFQASRNGNLQMITAAHCAADGRKFSHNTHIIGQAGVSLNGINPATFKGVDVSRTKVDVTGVGFPQAQNLLYATDAYKQWSITSVISNDQFYVGQGAGKSGRTTNYTFGTITSVHVDYRFTGPGGGPLIYYPDCWADQIENCPLVTGAAMGTYVEGGDSGSPVYSTVNFSPPMGDQLFGFVSARSPTTTYFATAKDTLTALDLDFWCKTPTCP